MSNIPEELYFTESHEWIRPDGETVTIGITDHAQSELGDVVYLELPKVGTRFEAGSVAAVIESVKAASDIYSPIPGEVIGVNESTATDPALVNRDPYGDGWLFRLRIANLESLLNGLMTAQEYATRLHEQ
ncbi:MAG: glycine cleavage system protein GcvH [Verrucomicrobiales bacterium]